MFALPSLTPLVSTALTPLPLCTNRRHPTGASDYLVPSGWKWADRIATPFFIGLDSYILFWFRSVQNILGLLFTVSMVIYWSQPGDLDPSFVSCCSLCYSVPVHDSQQPPILYSKYSQFDVKPFGITAVLDFWFRMAHLECGETPANIALCLVVYTVQDSNQSLNNFVFCWSTWLARFFLQTMSRRHMVTADRWTCPELTLSSAYDARLALVLALYTVTFMPRWCTARYSCRKECSKYRWKEFRTSSTKTVSAMVFH